MTASASPAIGVFGHLRALLEMIRFSHTLFAAPFAATAALLAWTTPAPDGSSIGFRWLELLGIIACMIGARSAAMAFNRLVDRRIDALNPRTKDRHLPAGILSVASVVTFTLFSASIFVLGTLAFLPNIWPLVLALPVLAFLCGYSYAKRFTSLAHYWLGIALALSPIATWIALRGVWLTQTPGDLLPSLVIGAAVAFWVAGFDVIYACQDQAFDAAQGLRSIPARWGVNGALKIAAASHAVMALFLLGLPFTHHLAGPNLKLGIAYQLGWLAIVVLLVYEHRLVRPDDLRRVNVAFFQVNVTIAFGLLALVILEQFV